MNTIVCKFGGTSLADDARIRNVGNIIRAGKSRRFIIVSAPGKRFAEDTKITDLLYDAAHLEGRQRVYKLFCVYRRLVSICVRLKIAPDCVGELLHMPQCADPDYIVSRGESICARMLAEYIRLPFADAAQIIHLDRNGRIDIRAARRALQKYSAAVIPGFYGTDPDGRIRALSRGGSDVTGSAVALACHADLYENWSDVDGICVADPAIVPRASCHTKIGMKQMLQIARCGAGILHPECIELLIGSKIDIQLKNTFRPDIAGTRIADEDIAEMFCITHARQNSASCKIFVFGCNRKCYDAICRLFDPACIYHMQNHLEITVPCVKYREYIRVLSQFA